jgi:hypothetical protein
MTIMVNLYDHALLFPRLTTNKGKGYQFPSPLLIFKRSKQGERVTIPLPSHPLSSPSPSKLPNTSLSPFM